jgi:hypothetical protein
MANYLNAGSVNLTGSFEQAESGAGAIATNKTTTANTTTGVVNSALFTGVNGHVCDGVLLSGQRLNTTGTITVTITNGTLSASVTVNASDLPTSISWIFFKFTSTVTFDGAATWKVSITASNAANAKFNTDTTANNWTRIPRITLTGTPGNADVVWVVNELTGAGTNSGSVVTMNQTSNATVYGDIHVTYNATLAYGITASTNYYLKMAGILWIWDSGTFSMGTQASPMPASSTAILEFNCASNVQYGIEMQLNGSLVTYGNAITFTNTKLNGDVAANATSLVTVDTTGWTVGDLLAMPSTSRTATESEAFNINTISGTTITVTGGGGTAGAIKNAHTGTLYNNTTWNADMRCEIINLTRNVKIRGISTSLQSYINANINSCTLNCNYTEFSQLGSATANKRGIDISNSSAPTSTTFNGCSFHDIVVASSMALNFTAASMNVNVNNCMFYNIANNAIAVAVTPGNNFTINGCIVVLVTTAGIPGINCLGVIPVFTNNTVAGCTGSPGIQIASSSVYTGTINNLVTHSCAGYGIIFQNFDEGNITNLSCWRNVQSGLQLLNIGGNLTIDGVTGWGNVNGTVYLNNGNGNGVVINNLISNSKAFTADALTQQEGILVGTSSLHIVGISNSNIGMTFPHTTGFSVQLNPMIDGSIVFYNTNFGDATVVGNSQNLTTSARIGSQRHNGIAGNHLSYLRNGNITIDSVIYDTSALDTFSERLTPSQGAGNKLRSGPFRIAISNGQTANVSLKIRQSVIGDGAAYNGVFPRVICLRNSAVGINSDTVMATATAAGQGSWEQLTFTTPAVNDDCVLTFYVDCDGTTGWINIDTIVVS